MNIAVTKTFASFINKTAKALGFKCHAEVIAIPASAYAFCTGYSRWDSEIDHDYATDTFKVIEVTYPYEYYATRKLLTTCELSEEFRRRKIETVEELQVMLRDMLEV